KRVIGCNSEALGKPDMCHRLECSGIIHCGYKIADPKWCSKADYDEIQLTCKPHVSIAPMGNWTFTK
ncbi:9550_t:CDS:2, partial [Entrophospora sp. SA101]